jgi:hypothetical protein
MASNKSIYHHYYPGQAIMKALQNKDALVLSGTHRHSVYADDDLLGKSINTMKKHTKAVLDASKKVQPETNAKTGMYIFMYFHQTAR